MIELNILPEVEQPEAPKQQEKEHIRQVDQIKLGNIQIADDGVENLRKLVNAYCTGKIGVTEAKAVSRLLEAFVKTAIALDAKVGLAALKRQVDYNERMFIQLMRLEKESVKGGNRR